jgi:hypothetical protein
MFRLVDICRDMQAMNILARNDELGSSRQAFYMLKNALIRHLYLKGCCTEAKVSIQKLPCWRCNGTGEDYWDDEYLGSCPRCYGTGVYREHKLYALTFFVAERRFRWHMPESCVNWPIELTETQAEPFQEPATEMPKLDHLHIQRMELRIWIGCKLQGIQGIPPLTGENWFRQMVKIWRIIHGH